jgi:SAM-dependent methyltransferase
MVLNDSATVIWHDLECGLYRADLPLWRELAWEQHDGPVLDIGAGTGRVTLDLAASGRELIALDLDPQLLAALRQRAPAQGVATICADARDFELELQGERPGLCLVPMQTIQLLGGSAGRLGFLRAAHRQLSKGALLACAIVTELEPFDCRERGPGPSPETVRVHGQIYSSQALRVELLPERIVIERERRIRSEDVDPAESSEQTTEVDVIELDRVSPRELEREARMVGFTTEPARTIAPTEEHTGSTVVMLRV